MSILLVLQFVFLLHHHLTVANQRDAEDLEVPTYPELLNNACMVRDNSTIRDNFHEEVQQLLSIKDVGKIIIMYSQTAIEHNVVCL